MKIRTVVVLLLALIGLVAVVKTSVGSVAPANIWTVSDALALIYEADESFGEDLFIRSFYASRGKFEAIAKEQAVCRNREAMKFLYRAHNKAARMALESPVRYAAVNTVHYVTQGISRVNFDKRLHKMPEQQRNRLLRNVCAIEEAFGL
jgi:hypothetical protein